MSSKCLACYQALDNALPEYHSKCSNLFFGNSHPPILPYTLDSLDDLAEKNVRKSITIPGVQEKLSLHLDKNNGDSGRLTLVGLWGDYILKPPVKDYPQMPEIEDLTMHLAALFGISTVPHCLIRLRSGELSYITRRIDRKDGHKIFHMEDMCQLTERLTEHKYRSSMEKISKTINKYSSHPLFDMVAFFHINLFSFICGNADMHLKNFSLYYRRNDLIQLAPAYDLVATRLLIPAKDDPEESALTINGKKSKLQRGDFDIFAKNIGLNEKQTLNVYKRMFSNMPKAFDFIDMSLLSQDKKKEFKKLITERITRLKL